jgi:hypothetical protein
MAGYRAQGLRLSLFYRSAPSWAESIWHLTAGGAPDSDEKRPKEGARRQSGRWRDATLEIVERPGRLDFVIQPISDPSNVMLDFGYAKGELQEFLKLFREVRALPSGDIHRVALGAVVASKMSSIAEANRELVARIKIDEPDVDALRDLLYRVNRPGKLKSGLTVNLLRTWTTFTIQMFGGETVPTASKLSETHVIRVELDFNTPQENTSPLDDVWGIVDELSELVKGEFEAGS